MDRLNGDVALRNPARTLPLHWSPDGQGGQQPGCSELEWRKARVMDASPVAVRVIAVLLLLLLAVGYGICHASTLPPAEQGLHGIEFGARGKLDSVAAIDGLQPLTDRQDDGVVLAAPVSTKSESVPYIGAEEGAQPEGGGAENAGIPTREPINWWHQLFLFVSGVACSVVLNAWMDKRWRKPRRCR